MNNPQLTQPPKMNTGMLIRKPVTEVFEAFINPEITMNSGSPEVPNQLTEVTQR